MFEAFHAQVALELEVLGNALVVVLVPAFQLLEVIVQVVPLELEGEEVNADDV